MIFHYYTIDDDSTCINDVHLSNIESHVIIGYNGDEDED